MDPGNCTYDYWFAQRELKYAADGVEHLVAPGATIRRATAVLQAIGVTKVADVTNLDRVGIPTFISVRPLDGGAGISYYNGKGTTRPAAHASALMEAVERHAGSRYDGPVIMMSHRNLRARSECIDPRDVLVPRVRDYDDNMLLEWIPGLDLLSRRKVLLPLNCVLAPYGSHLANAPLYSSTNGLASGNSRLEALCHALCELVERDAMAIAMARSHLRPAVAEILTSIGFDPNSLPERQDAPLISLKSLPRMATLLVRKLERAGLQVYLRNLTSPLGIATIGCTIFDPDRSSPDSGHGGCGAHPDARIAVRRALTEAAQSRLTSIQGGREDLPKLIPPRHIVDHASYGRGDTMEFADVPTCRHVSINEDVELLIERMQAGGFGHVVAVDLTNREVGIPVVRVVAPQAECWPTYCAATGRGAFGHRVLQAIVS